MYRYIQFFVTQRLAILRLAPLLFAPLLHYAIYDIHHCSLYFKKALSLANLKLRVKESDNNLKNLYQNLAKNVGCIFQRRQKRISLDSSQKPLIRILNIVLIPTSVGGRVGAYFSNAPIHSNKNDEHPKQNFDEFFQNSVGFLHHLHCGCKS